MRLIDGDALYETLCHIWDRTDSEDFEKAVFATIINAPTIESERKKGKWVLDNLNDGNGIVYHCTCCNWLTNHNQYAYCPNCGADKRGDENETD